MDAGKNDSAGSVNHFTKAIKAFPEFYEALSSSEWRKSIWAARRRQEKLSRRRSTLARKVRPSAVRVRLSAVLEGNADEAERILRRGLEVDGNAPDGHVILGMALLRLDRLDEAERSARERSSGGLVMQRRILCWRTCMRRDETIGSKCKI